MPTSAFLRHVGRTSGPVVTDEVTALAELVKNAYDADATYAHIVVDTEATLSPSEYRYASDRDLHLHPALRAGVAMVHFGGAEMLYMLPQSTFRLHRRRFDREATPFFINAPRKNIHADAVNLGIWTPPFS